MHLQFLFKTRKERKSVGIPLMVSKWMNVVMLWLLVNAKLVHTIDNCVIDGIQVIMLWLYCIHTGENNVIMFIGKCYTSDNINSVILIIDKWVTSNRGIICVSCYFEVHNIDWFEVIARLETYRSVIHSDDTCRLISDVINLIVIWLCTHMYSYRTCMLILMLNLV